MNAGSAMTAPSPDSPRPGLLALWGLGCGLLLVILMVAGVDSSLGSALRRERDLLAAMLLAPAAGSVVAGALLARLSLSVQLFLVPALFGVALSIIASSPPDAVLLKIVLFATIFVGCIGAVSVVVNLFGRSWPTPVRWLAACVLLPGTLCLVAVMSDLSKGGRPRVSTLARDFAPFAVFGLAVVPPARWCARPSGK